MSKRSARDFRNTNIQVNVGLDLQPGIWYRSPLWESDHLIGLEPAFLAETLAWCGRPLDLARDWQDEEFGGLWYSTRTGSKCKQCARRQTEYEYRKNN